MNTKPTKAERVHTDLRKLARGQECMVRLPRICNFNPETTVLAHLRTGWLAMGSKPPDICGVRACSACHDEIDGRTQILDPVTVKILVYHALLRLLHLYDREGIVWW